MDKVIIIAEAGVNHNGDMILAKKLVDAAASAGADFVKFQTFKAENLVTKDALMAAYQVANTKKEESQFEMLKRLELKETDFVELQNYAQKKNIKFFSTGFDLSSLRFLKTLKMGFWKIPSGEITNYPYLEFIGQQRETVYLSTGMATFEEVAEAVEVLIGQGTDKENIYVLQCTTDYPAQLEDVNLNAMVSMARKLGVKPGYSDHTLGIEISLAAVALGAKVIEKHFTLDKMFPGPDHLASLDPQELKQMVDGIRHIETSLGVEGKMPSSREIENRKVVRKSIVARIPISAGEVFTENNLTTKRPGTGISPMKIKQIIGTKASRSFKEDELIEL